LFDERSVEVLAKRSRREPLGGRGAVVRVTMSLEVERVERAQFDEAHFA